MLLKPAATGRSSARRVRHVAELSACLGEWGPPALAPDEPSSPEPPAPPALAPDEPSCARVGQLACGWRYFASE
ncbi:hypothetical protein [Streptomyces xanthochromogenes]|uniref:hypothetical protein n=1 Tax=Streptomyces xanthochromogenes TaxID=67384 RepID=UPI002F42377A